MYVNWVSSSEEVTRISGKAGEVQNRKKNGANHMYRHWWFT